MNQDFSEQVEDGARAMYRFAQMLVNHHPVYRTAPGSLLDTAKHIDLVVMMVKGPTVLDKYGELPIWPTPIINPDDQTLKTFDVKARKRVLRSGPFADENLFLLEWKNVYGGRSWLQGIATYIAFEQEWGFHVVQRKPLAEYVRTRINWTIAPVQTENPPVPFKKYQRIKDDRSDVFFYVPVKEVLDNVPHAEMRDVKKDYFKF